MACPLVRAWVVVVVVHFIVQVVLQSITLKDNMEAKNATSIFLSIPQVPVGVPLLKGDDLGLCDGIPGHRDVTCILISSMKDLPLMVRNDVGTSSLANFDLDDIYNVTMSGSEHSITGRCALSLQWIHDVWVIKTVFTLLRLTILQLPRQCVRRHCYYLLPVLAPGCVSIGSKSTLLFLYLGS